MKPSAAVQFRPIKAVLICHFEKVVFGVAAFIAFCLFSTSLFRKPYAENPEDLMRKADDLAAAVVRSTPPDSFADMPAKRDLHKMLRTARTQVNPDWFPMSELARPYSDHKVRRRQPKLLAVEDVRVFGGFGTIAIGGQDLGRERFESGRRGVRWTLSGLGARLPGSSSAMGNYDEESAQATPFPLMAGNSAFRPRAAAALPNYGGGSFQGQTAAGRGGGRFNDRRTRSRRPPSPFRKGTSAVLQSEKFTLDVPRGAKLAGRYWIAIAGLIPVWEHEAEYRRVFRDATKTFDSDVPLYLYCDVERAEIGLDGQAGEFKMLDMDRAADDLAFWAAIYPEPVDPRYLPQSADVAEPLPPLVFANHDPDRIRHPKIPLAVAAAERKAVSLKANKPQPAPESRRHRTASRIRGSQARRRQDASTETASGDAWGASAAASAKEDRIERQLMRFFDFSVEPGKTYKYRVRLALYNPNYAVATYYLADEKLSAAPEIFTDWSLPTAAASVPSGKELLAGGVDPAEPNATVLVRQFDSTLAITAVHVFQMSRGSTANADGIKLPMPLWAFEAKEPDSTQPKVDIKTDATMVDLVGGAPLVGGPAGAKAPGRMLVMDSDGELTMLSETTDAARFQIETAKLKTLSPKRAPSDPR